MTHCPKCSGLLLSRHGEIYCFACGARPLERKIEVKCAWTDCLAVPTIDGYCEACYGKRERSPLTRAERAARDRANDRASKQRARARKREAV